ncbi:MAG: T9SS type A sorting domain-containing protein [Chlorobi bacterium]|nr:T9SS type A sorting domain-containing protein [Chlorobiota bacterium]
MKNLGLLIVLVFFLSPAFSQYETPGTGVNWDLTDLVGNSSGAVTLQDGIYFFNEDILISALDTFHISTDETVKIGQGRLITVSGVLIANPPEGITFTAIDTTLNFLGFRFEESSSSILAKCTVEFGGGIKLIETDMVFEDCVFRKNNVENSTGAINLFHSSPVISNSGFYLNEGPAIMSGANSESSPRIFQNAISQNNTLNQNMPQINLGTSKANDTIWIMGNTIQGFYDNAGGMAVSTLAGGNLECVIRENNIVGNRYGIAVYGNSISSVIEGNTITGNNIQGDPLLGGSGINFWGNESNVSLVSENTISGNLWGVTIQGTARPNMGQVEPDTANIGENLIFDNGNEGTVYALYNNTPNDVFAENNYWGTYSLDTVEMYIFHQPDDPALGFVDYLPIKDYVTAVPEIDFSKSNSFEIYPNPARGFIKLVFTNEENSFKKISVFNSTGKLVKRTQSEDLELEIDISDIPKGLYFIGLQDGKRTGFQKFIKR